MGDEPQNYYEIIVTLRGYTYALGPVDAAEEAGVLAVNWTEHCDEIVVTRVEEPESRQSGSGMGD